jgi:hypothetical protein
MADANARLERLHRCNAVRGNTEPIIHRQHVSVTSQDFIKFWGNFFSFILLVLIEIHKDLKLLSQFKRVFLGN